MIDDKISSEELKKLLGIGESAFYSYIKSGHLPKPMKSADSGALFSRSQIARIIGLKELPDEPLLTTRDALKILKIPESHGDIRRYCDRRKIPYYTLKDGKGAKTYFLHSELMAASKYALKWGTSFPDFVARNYFVAEVVKYVFSPTVMSKLRKKDVVVINKAFFERWSLKDIAAELKCTESNARYDLIVACKRALFELRAMEQKMKYLDSTFEENIRLRSENKVLLDKLNAGLSPESKVLKEEISLLARQIKSTPVSLGSNTLKRVSGFLDYIEATILNDLVKYKMSDIKKYRNVGKATLEAIESLLKANGLRFKPEDDELVKVPQKELNEAEKLKQAMFNIEERLRSLEKGNNNN